MNFGLVIGVDKYHFHDSLPSCRASTKRIKRALIEAAGATVQELQSNQVARGSVIDESIEKLLLSLKNSSDQAIIYFAGRAQCLIRFQESRLYLGLPTFLSGRQKSTVELNYLLSLLSKSVRSLLFLDVPVSNWIDSGILHTRDQILSSKGIRAIICTNRDASVDGRAIQSAFSTAVERAIRRASDLPGSFRTPDLAIWIFDELEALGFSGPIGVVADDGYDDLTFGIEAVEGCGLVEHYYYLIHNLYSYHPGSRQDAVDDLQYIAEGNGELELRNIAKSRLAYLANFDESTIVRNVASRARNRYSSICGPELLEGIKTLAASSDIPVTVPVTSGIFVMGTDSKDYYPAAIPQHEVYIPDYEIGRHLVTVRQFALYVAETSASPPYNWVNPDWLADHAHHPVTCVSWLEACSYCDWLTTKIRHGGSLPDHIVFRLPTEAEWEKAARGAEGWIHPWGDLFDANCCNVRASGVGTTTPVGFYSPRGDSSYGCADMVGNAREWTASLWGLAGNVTQFPYPYSLVDGRDSLSADTSWRRVVRGGGYYYDEACSNGIVRNRAFVHNKHDGGGFRVVRASNSK